MGYSLSERYELIRHMEYHRPMRCQPPPETMPAASALEEESEIPKATSKAASDVHDAAFVKTVTTALEHTFFQRRRSDARFTLYQGSLFPSLQVFQPVNQSASTHRRMTTQAPIEISSYNI